MLNIIILSCLVISVVNGEGLRGRLLKTTRRELHPYHNKRFVVGGSSYISGGTDSVFLTFKDAVKFCAEMGRSMVVPESWEETHAIKDAILEHMGGAHFGDNYRLGREGRIHVWLGLKKTHNHWVRRDHEELTWTNWPSGEGQDSGETRAAMNFNSSFYWNGEWFDAPADDDRTMYAVCGKELAKNNQQKCADENGTCTCNGVVKYGVGTHWFKQTINGSIGCNNDVFGDPIHDKFKHCICESERQKCADENGHCKCTGEVYYGYGSQWMWRGVKGSITCSNSAVDGFGVDPFPGQAKICICQTYETPTNQN